MLLTFIAFLCIVNHFCCCWKALNFLDMSHQVVAKSLEQNAQKIFFWFLLPLFKLCTNLLFLFSEMVVCWIFSCSSKDWWWNLNIVFYPISECFQFGIGFAYGPCGFPEDYANGTQVLVIIYELCKLIFFAITKASRVLPGLLPHLGIIT